LSEGKGREEGLILIGKVLRPHGLKGDLWIRYYNPDPLFLLNYKRILLKDKRRGILRDFEVKGVSIKERGLILSLEGISDRKAAERWTGSDIYVKVEDLPPLGPGEYYYKDVIGMDVFDINKAFLGKVVDIISTASNDVYVIETQNGELMLPAIEGVIQEISIEEKKIIVKVPEEE